jgi:hypothetical protein
MPTCVSSTFLYLIAPSYHYLSCGAQQILHDRLFLNCLPLKPGHSISLRATTDHPLSLSGLRPIPTGILREERANVGMPPWWRATGVSAKPRAGGLRRAIGTVPATNSLAAQPGYESARRARIEPGVRPLTCGICPNGALAASQRAVSYAAGAARLFGAGCPRTEGPKGRRASRAAARPHAALPAWRRSEKKGRRSLNRTAAAPSSPATDQPLAGRPCSRRDTERWQRSEVSSPPAAG